MSMRIRRDFRVLPNVTIIPCDQGVTEPARVGPRLRSGMKEAPPTHRVTKAGPRPYGSTALDRKSGKRAAGQRQQRSELRRAHGFRAKG